MTKALRTHCLAEDELTVAALWDEAKQPGLGVTFLDLVDHAIDRLRVGLLPSSPVPGVKTAKNAERVLLKTFPLLNSFLRAPG